MLSLVVVDSSVYQTDLHSEFNYGNIFGSFALRSDAEANLLCIQFKYMSHFAYACKTEGENGISRLISALCVNCLSSIPEYSRLNHLDVYLV